MTAEDNRAKMPTVAKFVDQCRAVFGDGVKVIWARENGIELGRPLDTSKLAVPCIDERKLEKPTTKRRR